MRVAIRLEAVHVDMHRMREVRDRRGAAGAHHVLHRFVARDEPLHIDGLLGYSAALQRIRREARPQDHAVGKRVTGSDAEREGVSVELDRAGGLRARTERPERRERGDARGGSEERAAIHHGRAGPRPSPRARGIRMGRECGSIRGNVGSRSFHRTRLE